MNGENEDAVEELRNIRRSLWRKLSKIAPMERLAHMERAADEALKRAGITLKVCRVDRKPLRRLRRSG